MPREDRERNFENALARNLRSDRPEGAGTHACPDAELLAAYHERSLPLQEAISWKEHIAGCPRCQQVLAHLEATDEIVLDAEQEEYVGQRVPAMDQSDLAVLTPAGLRASAPVNPPTSVAVAIKSAERRGKVRRPANWRWLAPAGAIAAGLILWVAFHKSASEPLQMAKNQPASAAVRALPPPSPSASAGNSREPSFEPQAELKQQETPLSPSPTLSQTGPAPAEKKSAGGENFSALQKKEPPAAPLGKTDEKTKADRERDTFAEKSATPPLSARNTTAFQAPPSGRFDARKDAGDLSTQSGAVGGTPSPAVPPAASGGAGAAASSSAPAPPPSVADQAVSQPAKETPPPAAASESVAVVNQNTMLETRAEVVNGAPLSNAPAQTMRLARNQVPVTITTPNPKVLWRIEAAGIAQRSTDAGSTWTLQKTRVVADLTAGSAPSEEICWIVGRAGTILRTTDAGAHWRKVRSPVADDLSTIFAIDAQQATISTASNHKTYKTSDAGRTWTPVPNP